MKNLLRFIAFVLMVGVLARRAIYPRAHHQAIFTIALARLLIQAA